MLVLNEQTSFELPISLKNRNGVAQAPMSAEYRIDCPDAPAGSQQIRDWTPFPELAASVKILLNSDDNDTKSALAKERHVITVRATYGVDSEDMVTGEYTYQVKNLQFLP